MKIKRLVVLSLTLTLLSHTTASANDWICRLTNCPAVPAPSVLE